MRATVRRALLVDSVLGLVLALVCWQSAHFAWSAAPDGGPFADRGPGGHGPRHQPDVVFVVGLSPWLLPAALLVGLGVALRRWRPRLAFVLVVAGVAGYSLAGGRFGLVFLAPALAVYAMAAALPVRRWLGWTVLLVPMIWCGFLDQPYAGLLDPGFYAGLVLGVAIAVAPASFALLRRARLENGQRERDQERQRYLDEERLRIAREVHDVVGHSLSVITMQAGVAMHLLQKETGPAAIEHRDQVADSLEAIRRSSKEALAELRTTIGVFRDSDGAVVRAPLPGLARLGELVNALRRAGRTVVLREDPAAGHDEQAPVPAAVDQAAFRIIQEALTNVVRHSEQATAVVTVARRGAALHLEVADDGPARSLPVEGNGLRGMRERARAVGGDVTLSLAEPSGLVVRAVLPVAAEVRTP